MKGLVDTLEYPFTIDKFVKRKDVSDVFEVETDHTMKPTKSSTKEAKFTIIDSIVMII